MTGCGRGSHINQLLLQQGYLESVTADGQDFKRVTPKGAAAGIQEEEVQSQKGNRYYAITHTPESQRLLVGLLQEFFAGREE